MKKKRAHSFTFFFSSHADTYHNRTHTLTHTDTVTGQQTNETHKNLYWSTGSKSELQEWTEWGWLVCELSNNLVLFACVWHNRSFVFICACHCNENLFYFWIFHELIDISHLTFRTSNSSQPLHTSLISLHLNRQQHKYQMKSTKKVSGIGHVCKYFGMSIFYGSSTTVTAVNICHSFRLDNILYFVYYIVLSALATTSASDWASDWASAHSILTLCIVWRHMAHTEILFGVVLFLLLIFMRRLSFIFHGPGLLERADLATSDFLYTIYQVDVYMCMHVIYEHFI